MVPYLEILRRCAVTVVLGMVLSSVKAETADIPAHFLNLVSGNRESIERSLNAIE